MILFLIKKMSVKAQRQLQAIAYLGKIPEPQRLSIVIQVRTLKWQPQKLPKQCVGKTEIDPSSLWNQTVSKSSVLCSF